VRTALTEKEQRDYLLSKIKEPVHFTYPEPPYHFEGTLKDRFVIKDGYDANVTYWNIIDLIEFKGENEDWLRITYYRYKKKEKRWVFAGQTSLSNPISQYEELFVQAIKEKQWMKTFFKQILRQCSDLK
jgi:hypothetical protein